MMNRKCIFGTIVLFSMATVSLCADETMVEKKSLLSNIHFSLSPYVQFLYGNQYESVYFNNSNSTRLLSQLVWDQKPLYIGGLQIRTGYNDFFLNASIQSALPKTNCGTVADSDWLNVQDFPLCSDTAAAIKTNYTDSICKLDSYYELNTQVGYTFHLTSDFSMTPYAEFNYSYSSYYAMGCTGSYYDTRYTESTGYYGTYDDDEHSYPIYFNSSTATMQLQRSSYFTWAGLTYCYEPSKRFNVSLSFSLSAFEYVQSLDTHLLRKFYFLDIMSGYLNGIKIALNTSYSFTKQQSLHATIGGTLLDEVTGNDYYRNGSVGSYARDSTIVPGCNYTNVTATLAYEYRFN